ncbi:MAG: hypothetical protein Q8M92_06125 [Candidatus Subteraquimicrobiales bacterium]|nr:hypothetical protein [Candidatus Subteraquimicrobiales bacterium]
MKFQPRCLPTAIGSLPHIDANQACRIVFENLKEIPAWPQLPKRTYFENMYVQYTEGMPCLVLDLKKERLYFNTADKDKLVDEASIFYSYYIKHDLDKFAISDFYANGLHHFLELLDELPEAPVAIKGQVTGPISFSLTVTDEHKKPILYNLMLFDIIVRTLARKAEWQERKFKEILPGVRTIIFFDEPYLMAYGSAFISLGREQCISSLSEVVSACSGLTGVHCCGRTDWTLFSECGVDIISFDAYKYIDNLALYPVQVKEFLDRGGILAWGIVPSTLPAIERVDVDILAKKFEECVQLLEKKGIDRETLIENALITPSCGVTSLPVELAEKAYQLTKALSERLRKRYYKSD